MYQAEYRGQGLGQGLVHPPRLTRGVEDGQGLMYTTPGTPSQGTLHGPPYTTPGYPHPCTPTVLIHAGSGAAG